MGSYNASGLSGRRYPRVHAELPLFFRVLNPEKEREWISTRTRILGGGGMLVASSVSLPVGTILHAKLNYYAHVIEFTAEIVWVEPSTSAGASLTQYGLNFIQISQDNLLTIHDILNRRKTLQFSQF